MLYRSAHALWKSFSGLGLILGALFFAASLTPSLIPRDQIVQGVLGGVSFALGYLLGVFLLWLWEYLELPTASARVRRVATWGAAIVAAAIVLSFLWRAADWQDSIREMMGMPPVGTAHPLQVGAIAAVVFLALLAVGRLFAWKVGFASRWLGFALPRRLAGVLGLVVAVALFASIANGILFRGFLHLADSSFQAADEWIEPDAAPPASPRETGSAASLIDWQDLGRTGRDFVSSGPSRADIRTFLGEPAKDPIRVFVGLNAADSAEARAELALRELVRVGAFERAVLIVAVPTGTGWMDPTAMETVEYLHRGDVATVAQQYSYLTSWISLLVEPDYAADTARELFDAVYEHWRTLPKGQRPRLYLYGLSLGALGSQQSLQLYNVIGDPPHGALWVGPPFPSTLWQEATADRQPGSPAWRPIFEGGSLLRFTNHGEHLDLDGAEWGPLRAVYLQHASDPIVFFEPGSFFRRPDWMNPPPGPGVSPELRWYPGVTFLQLLVDMAIGLAVPMGHGHLYSYADHIDPWIEVTQPAGWSDSEIARLRQHLQE